MIWVMLIFTVYLNTHEYLVENRGIRAIYIGYIWLYIDSLWSEERNIRMIPLSIPKRIQDENTFWHQNPRTSIGLGSEFVMLGFIISDGAWGHDSYPTQLQWDKQQTWCSLWPNMKAVGQCICNGFDNHIHTYEQWSFKMILSSGFLHGRVPSKRT